jgi:protein TonB
MFEDSTFESNGRIRTRSRGWMVAALILDVAILLAFILIPLVYPEALPNQAMAFLMEVPAPPVTPPPAAPRQAAGSVALAEEMGSVKLEAPRQIPRFTTTSTGGEPGDISDIDTMDPRDPVAGLGGDAFGSQHPIRVVHQDVVQGPTAVPSSVAAGLLIRKVVPVYPPLAKVMRVEGTVELAATISKTGNIVNLRLISGPPALEQAACDAVSSWRYRPYLLNGQPVDVETTIKIIFTLGG